MGVLTDFRVVSADNRQIWLPLDWQGTANKRVIVWCHGAGATYAPGPVEKFLVHSGFPMVCSDLGGTQTWGSDASITAVTTAWTWAKDNYGVKTDKMLLWGGSMGSYTALQYAKENAANVAAVGAALAICDPEPVRSGDLGGYQSEIEAIHGVGTPVPTAKRPLSNPSAFTMPVKLWYSADDTVGRDDDTIAFEAAVATCDITALETYAGHPGGHSYLVLAAPLVANYNDIVQFLRPYIA